MKNGKTGGRKRWINLAETLKAVVHKEIVKPATVRYQKPGGIVADEDAVSPFSCAEGVCAGSVMLNGVGRRDDPSC